MADAGTHFGSRANAAGHSEEVFTVVSCGGSEAEQCQSAALEYTQDVGVCRRVSNYRSRNGDLAVAQQPAMMVVCSSLLYSECQQALAALVVGKDNPNCFKQPSTGFGGTVRSRCDEGLGHPHCKTRSFAIPVSFHTLASGARPHRHEALSVMSS